VLSGLDLNKLYSIKGTAIRGDPDYTNRWALFELRGAVSFTSAHSDGALTRSQVAQVATNQVALNTGANGDAGDIFDWENVRPGDTGVIVIMAQQYSGPVPGGTSAGASYAYGTTALRVEEFASTNQEPILITGQPRSLTVVEHLPATFTVTATGSPRFYQWYRGLNPIVGATAPSYVIAACAPNNSDVYSVVITNNTGSVTSALAVLTVNPDQEAPSAWRAVGLQNRTQVLLSFSEAVEPESATADPTNTYLLAPTLGGPALPVRSAVLSDGTNVLLFTALRAPDRNYTLFVSNVTDQSSQFNLLEPNPTLLPLLTEASLVSVAATQQWRFSESGTPETGWTAPGFDDRHWSNGPPVFVQAGNEPGLPGGYLGRTALRAAENGGPITTYFRTRFHLPGPAADVRLTLRHVIDDGAVFYLNGVEAHRVRLPSGPLVPDTLATNAPEPHPLEGPVLLSTAALLEGENTLAVEVHQGATTSSDVVMGAELTALLPSLTETNVPGPSLLLTLGSPGQVALSWFAPTFSLQQAASVDGPWRDVPGASPPYLVEPTNQAGFFRLRR
jgi:hypothetical protein